MHLSIAALLLAGFVAVASALGGWAGASGALGDGAQVRAALLQPLAVTVALFDRDHDRARDAVRGGEIKSLQEIVRIVRGRYPGRQLDARLARDRSVYELRWQTEDGRILDITVDARTGRIRRVR